ncbi:hypothetical protein ACFLZY_00415 [Patescibacteria group bacterium]
MDQLPHTLIATIEAISNETVSLKTKDGQTINWPQRLLKNTNLGDQVHLLALSDTESAQERDQLARSVLNEMLHGK